MVELKKGQKVSLKEDKDRIFVVIKQLEDGRIQVRDSKDKIHYLKIPDIETSPSKKTTPRSFA